MHRLALVAVVALVLVPAASPAQRDACSVTATPVRGAAPLQVTFTATCTSSSYAWSFGDGQQAQGASVVHDYAAGLWAPELTTDAGPQTLPAVTSISLALTGPKVAKYAEWVTLHASVTPSLPVAVRGRRVVGGRIRFRALSTQPYVAFADGVRSEPWRITLAPKLVVHVARIATVGQDVKVRASLHPASAGSVRTTTVSTATPGTVKVLVTSKPAAGWQAVDTTATVVVVQPTLTVGSTGRSVVALEQALAAEHYLLPGRSAMFSAELTDALYAFQKVNRLPRTGIADAATWRALAAPIAARPRYTTPSFHIEVNKPLQVLYVVRDGRVAQIVPISTAGLPGRFTPVGTFAVYRKVLGFDPSPLGTLFDPSYFTGGYAIHGNPSVPPYPASHGCVRVPMWAAPLLYDEMPYGTVVDVY